MKKENREDAKRAKGSGGGTFFIIHEAIRGIKKGRIRTYGEVAQQAGVSVRTVVWALKSCPAGVPWHRVVGKGGKIVLASRSPLLGARQAHLLSLEGWTVSDWQIHHKRAKRASST
ncbi:MAG TPA: MGMT family protein [Acidobacteriota bacterium]